MAANCKVSAAGAGSIGGWGVQGVFVRSVGVYSCPRSVQCVFGGVFKVKGVHAMAGWAQQAVGLVGGIV